MEESRQHNSITSSSFSLCSLFVCFGFYFVVVFGGWGVLEKQIKKIDNDNAKITEHSRTTKYKWSLFS